MSLMPSRTFCLIKDMRLFFLGPGIAGFLYLYNKGTIASFFGFYNVSVSGVTLRQRENPLSSACFPKHPLKDKADILKIMSDVEDLIYIFYCQILFHILVL